LIHARISAAKTKLNQWTRFGVIFFAHSE